jgi:hypothetical protein
MEALKIVTQISIFIIMFAVGYYLAGPFIKFLWRKLTDNNDKRTM